MIGFTFRGSNSFGLICAAFINSGANSYKKGIYDTLLNDTSSTEPFGRKSCVEVSFCRISTWSKQVFVDYFRRNILYSPGRCIVSANHVITCDCEAVDTGGDYRI